jgi:hypothetical protein
VDHRPVLNGHSRLTAGSHIDSVDGNVLPW